MSSSLGEFAQDVLAGLARSGQRELPSKYLYDDLGSALFEAITRLPEYGLTRADERLLRAHSPGIAAALPPGAVVAELGSGSGKKTVSILESLQARTGHKPRYYPIDLSTSALNTCARELASCAAVTPIEASYLDGIAQASALRTQSQPLLVLFLGSTIGNFDLSCAVEFLAALRSRLSPGDALLLGADLVKPVPQMLLAYDDPTGVTAAFNRNILGRINRELGADFNLTAYEHEARYHEPARRIEMHLRARSRQRVSIPNPGFRITIEPGETIWTESSHKFLLSDLDSLASRSGFRSILRWMDSQWPFAENLWSAVE
ncbi:MAG: L-histidine N(alpha)-methyltransferase [Bryobacterales bacterium]|nr:L-histidine N(alpha)-methyltransferase [Bryobacterales bacterium]